MINYRAYLNISGVALSGFGTIDIERYRRQVSFNSDKLEPEDIVLDAVAAVRRDIVDQGYSTNPNDNCVTAEFERIVSLRDGMEISFDKGLVVKVSQIEILLFNNPDKD